MELACTFFTLQRFGPSPSLNLNVFNMCTKLTGGACKIPYNCTEPPSDSLLFYGLPLIVRLDSVCRDGLFKLLWEYAITVYLVMKSKSNKLSNKWRTKTFFYAYLSISFSPKHKHDPRSPPPTTGSEFLKKYISLVQIICYVQNSLILMDVI